jgi:sigma-54 dependent transcriptional regulator, acetoin dehydrogenase operon transcriptional activator AcoR
MQSASNWEARDRATAAARERFVAGSDCGQLAVRPEILLSWHRCRDEYKIDPGQSRAPSADDYCDHSLKNDRVVTELGSVGRSLLEDVEALGGLVAITDGAARILTAWGDRQALRHGEQSNLAPWSAWSERATGTNGMGTALEYSGEILVSRCEHWCEGLQDWSCAGTTIRDPVTGQALGVLDVSSWRKPLPDTVLPWLRSAVEGVRAELREQARHDMSDLEAALKGRGRRAPSSVFALDAGGGVVAVSNKGTAPGGTSLLTITVDCPALRECVRKGVTRARADHSWVGYVECFIPHVGDVVPFTIRPVVKNNRVIGALGTLGESAGEHLSLEARSTESSNGLPQRVAAVEGNRLIILHPQQIIFAEAERNSVWLTTDRGRIRARERGLERLVGQLHDSGFIRVHRHFAVNARRVREIKHGFRGQLSLVMDPGARKTVPVSRRREATVRRALELLLCSHSCGLSVAAFLGSAVGRTIGRVRSRARAGWPEPRVRAWCSPGVMHSPRSSPWTRAWIWYSASPASWSPHVRSGWSHTVSTAGSKEPRPPRERETGQPGFSLQLPDAGRPGVWVRVQRGCELAVSGAQGLLVGFFAPDEVDQGLCLVVGELD